MPLVRRAPGWYTESVRPPVPRVRTGRGHAGVKGMRWRAGASVLLGAVLAVTAGCGAEDPEVSAEPTAEPAGTAGPFEWVKVEQDFQLETAAAMGDGFVGQTVEVKPDADETTEFPFIITVVTSPDGVTWTEADVPVVGPDEGVFWHSGGPWGAVASIFGPSSESPVPDLLFTTDGVEWVRGRLPDDVLAAAQRGFGPESYAVGPAGVMAAAPFDGPEGTQSVVLLSDDLQTWREVEHPLPTSGDMGLEVTASPNGTYLLSRPVAGAPGPVPILGYVSVDGQSWGPVTSLEEYAIAGGGNDWSTGWRDGFAVMAELFVEGGGPDEGPGRSQIWLSTPDGTWVEADLSAAGVSHLVPELHGSSLGLLAVGEVWPEDGSSEPGNTYLLFSADGESWEAISTRDTFGVPDPPTPVVMGETALMVGIHPRGTAEPSGMQIWLGTPTRT